MPEPTFDSVDAADVTDASAEAAATSPSKPNEKKSASALAALRDVDCTLSESASSTLASNCASVAPATSAVGIDTPTEAIRLPPAASEIASAVFVDPP